MNLLACNAALSPISESACEAPPPSPSRMALDASAAPAGHIVDDYEFVEAPPRPRPSRSATQEASLKLAQTVMRNSQASLTSAVESLEMVAGVAPQHRGVFNAMLGHYAGSTPQRLQDPAIISALWGYLKFAPSPEASEETYNTLLLLAQFSSRVASQHHLIALALSEELDQFGSFAQRLQWLVQMSWQGRTADDARTPQELAAIAKLARDPTIQQFAAQYHLTPPAEAGFLWWPAASDTHGSTHTQRVNFTRLVAIAAAVHDIPAALRNEALELVMASHAEGPDAVDILQALASNPNLDKEFLTWGLGVVLMRPDGAGIMLELCAGLSNTCERQLATDLMVRGSKRSATRYTYDLDDLNFLHALVRIPHALQRAAILEVLDQSNLYLKDSGDGWRRVVELLQRQTPLTLQRVRAAAATDAHPHHHCAQQYYLMRVANATMGVPVRPRPSSVMRGQPAILPFGESENPRLTDHDIF